MRTFAIAILVVAVLGWFALNHDISWHAYARVFHGRVYNHSSQTLEAWASGHGRLQVAPKSTTGKLDVDHVQVCGQWYKIQFDGWIRVYDGCKLGRLGTQCKTTGPGRPCS